MLFTRFTELVGCELPIQAAPVGSFAASSALPAAVARAGGHGMVAALDLAPAGLARVIAEVEEAGGRAYGVNFVVPLMNRASFAAAIEAAPLVEFHYGDPDPALVLAAHAGGALVSWQVGSETEARKAEAAGVDLIVAQGIEAAGRTRGRAGTMALLSRVLDVVATPVVAAGGIGNARGVAAVLAAGAAAARIGTRFLGTYEAAVPPAYAKALLAAGGEDTVLTDRIRGRGPQVPARLLRTSLLDGEADAETAFFAGESVAFVERLEPAAEIVRDLAEGAERLLGRWATAAARG
jgi:NAD(P)H-dependent flavin oxidoreductase YrpB (nitropropane dioxygenase family)